MSQKNKLFVGGLSQNVTQDTLYETFDKYGKIEDGELKRASCFCFLIYVVKLNRFRCWCELEFLQCLV
jgi:RNA recognition motif-containing protein